MRATGRSIRNKSLANTEVVIPRRQSRNGEWQSEEDFSVLLANIADAILKSRNGTIVWCNDRVNEVLGYTREELVGTDANFLFPEADDFSELRQEAYRQTESEGGLRGTTKIKKKDGSTALVEFSISPIQSKNPAEFVVVASDITKRKLAEEALRKAKGELEERVRKRTQALSEAVQGLKAEIYERTRIEEELRYSEERFRALIENASDAITVLNEDGTLRYESPSTRRLLGYEPESTVGKTSFELIHPDDISSVMEDFARLLHDPGGTVKLDVRVLHSDGSWRNLEVVARNLLDDPAVQGIVVNQRDITERKKAEDALRESEEKLTLYLESSPDAIFISDHRGVFLYGNRQAEKIIGYSREELIGQSFLDLNLIAPDYLQKAAELLEMNKAGKPTGPDEFMLIRKDGERVSIEVSTYPLGEGEKIEVIGIARDISDRKHIEEALRSSEEIYRMVVENANEAIVVAQDGLLKFVNRNVTEITGYSREELISKPFIDLIYTDDRKMVVERHLQRLGGEQIPSIYPFRIVDKDGTVKWVEINAVMITWDGRAATLNFLTDVTERMRAEEAVLEAERRYRAIFNNRLAMVFINDQDGNFIDANDRALESLGYTRDDIGKINFQDIVHPDDIIKPLAIIADGLLTKEQMERPLELRLVTSSGEIIWVEVFGIPVEVADNRYIGLGMAHIITERKKAEEKLRNSEEYFRSLIENAQDGIAIVNAEGTILYESPAFERILGYRLKEHIGENALLFAHQDDLPTITASLAQLLQTPGGFVQAEARVWHKDGSLRTVEVVGHNLLDNPSVGGIVANVRDITERRRAEEDKEKMEQQLQLAGRLAAVGELAAGVAHELNNPLAAIQAYAEFLTTKDDLAESLRKDTAIIHREAQRAARVTANLLSFARRSVPEKSLISINDVLEKSLELHAYRMKVNNIEVKYELDPDLPRTMADFHQLQQVFINIINNAEQAMTEANGNGNLTVKTQSLSRMIRASFIDDGPGIAEEDLQKIFDPFYTTKAVGKGTGLGLSISFGIIQDHGGRLYARSKSGKGTMFIVEIPIVSES